MRKSNQSDLPQKCNPSFFFFFPIKMHSKEFGERNTNVGTILQLKGCLHYGIVTLAGLLIETISSQVSGLISTSAPEVESFPNRVSYVVIYIKCSLPTCFHYYSENYFLASSRTEILLSRQELSADKISYHKDDNGTPIEIVAFVRSSTVPGRPASSRPLRRRPNA